MSEYAKQEHIKKATSDRMKREWANMESRIASINNTLSSEKSKAKQSAAQKEAQNRQEIKEKNQSFKNCTKMIQ